MTPTQAIISTARYFGVPALCLHGRSRVTCCVHAREVCAWMMRDAGMGYPAIGRAMGRSGHATAHDLVRRFRLRMFDRGEVERADGSRVGAALAVGHIKREIKAMQERRSAA
jgi:chromosomal replication initiation ATPase DnaA